MNLIDRSLPGYSVLGIFQARIQKWVVISFPRESSLPRAWTQVSYIAGRFFIIWATRVADVSQQSIYIYPLPHEPPFRSAPPSHPSRSSQSTELSSLCYTRSFPEAIYFIYNSVCVYQAYCLNSSQLFLPPQCPQIHSQCLHLYSFPQFIIEWGFKQNGMHITGSQLKRKYRQKEVSPSHLARQIQPSTSMFSR